MSQTPTLNGQSIGEAGRATRAVLDRLLTEHGLAFLQWVPLNLLVDARGTIAEEAMVARLVAGLRITPDGARAALGGTVAVGLAERTSGNGPARVEITERGADVYAHVRAGIDAIAGRLYGDLPADDLATAGRVLATVTERAIAELAS